MSTPANDDPAAKRRDYNDYTQAISVRYIDDAKLRSVLDTAFGNDGYDMWMFSDRFYIKAPRQLTEDEIRRCQR
ncbi:hypothetical protein F4803DRAFT_557071 [Xylaria telfairii]|nr:hypothetical protein F4803DRAFT_557071 [Xylaria telfairii]